ncbi:MAG: NAD-dependent epimerase/dehydratase family protein [bacterium]|nr:NAD-dependent epimerase/dehydratase family protein [bacterium]
MQKVLIVGVARGQGRLLARRLSRNHKVVGVDTENWSRRPAETPFYRVDVRTRGFEDVLRKEQPDTVVHLGFVRHFRDKPDQRHDVNVRGTRKLLDHCRNHGVKRISVLSTSYVYGALPENPNFMDEDYPLLAGRNYPEIRDLVEVDTISSAFMWRYPDVQTSILRPVPTLGYYVENSIVNYLRQRRVVVMMGFNPMLQFMHEEDLSEAIALTVERNLRGVYNVCGPGEVPLRIAIQETGATALSLPEPLARPVLDRMFRLGLFGVPTGAIDYIKYPCTIDGERFANSTGFRPLFGLKESFRSLRR